MRFLTLPLLLLFCCPAMAAERVEILFQVPAGLESYSGQQPVTFGVPFPPATLRTRDRLRVVDADGRPMPAQFETTATWTPGSDEVRWLLIDLLVPLQCGRAPGAYLEFGPDVPALPPTGLGATMEDNRAVIETGQRRLVVDRAMSDLGQFILVDGSGTQYCAGAKGGRCELALEKSGPVRAVVRLSGEYVAADGRKLGEYVTRVRCYAGCPFLRLYHTMIWTTDARARIGKLAFLPAALKSGATAAAGLDGRRVGPASTLSLAQTQWNQVTGTARGRQLDGWIELSDESASLWAGLRWPWQQFPTGLKAADGQIAVGLLAPEQPMSLAPMDVAVEAVKPESETWNLRIFNDAQPWSVTANGKEAFPLVSPRGVARTFEILLWPETGTNRVAAEVKNVLVQHPVLAYADPAFATRVGLPSPSSPYNPGEFPAEEAALQRAFAWFTREEASDGDYGAFNWGDLQWCWRTSGGYSVYRYWMNHGKGWSILPWTLWLRSGDRRYWENGEANSRHAMDVDTCHVPEWRRAADGKIRGGQYHYSALHWGYGPEVSSFYSDSEYLPYCYYMTGYERARDVLLERAEAMARDNYLARAERFQDRALRSRHLYAPLKDVCLLYEATWDPRLLPQAETYFRLTLDAQLPSGMFVGIKTNHYLDKTLQGAGRVMDRTKTLEALRKWQAFLGDPRRAEVGCAISGPMSLWTMIELAGHTGDSTYRDVAAEVLRAQAAAVDDTPGSWYGLNPFPAHEAGPILRDWPVVIQALAALPADQRPTACAPMLYFQALLPLSKAQQAEAWKDRHVVLVLAERNEPLVVRLWFLAHNVGSPRKVRVRVIDPGGSVATTHEQSLRPGVLADPGDPPMAIRIEPRGMTGVYALEVLASIPRPALCADSSAGKLVYFAPTKQLSMCSPFYAGQAWFEPKGDEEVMIAPPLGRALGRMAIADADGRVVAVSRVAGTKVLQGKGKADSFPEAAPCRFRPKAVALHSLSGGVTNSWHAAFTVSGIKPFVAARKSQWFDPSRHPCCDLDTLLTP